MPTGVAVVWGQELGLLDIRPIRYIDMAWNLASAVEFHSQFLIILCKDITCKKTHFIDRCVLGLCNMWL
jgi:hypothetical protein